MVLQVHCVLEKRKFMLCSGKGVCSIFLLNKGKEFFPTAGASRPI